VLALAMALGIWIGACLPALGPWPWIAIGTAGAVAAVTTPRHRARARAIVLLRLAITASAIGAAALAHHEAPVRALTGWVADGPRLVNVHGRALAGPEHHPAGADSHDGSMSAFDYRGPVTTLPLRLEAIGGADGRLAGARGRLAVVVGGSMPPFAAGDLVAATGLLDAPAPPLNPGEADRRTLALSRGVLGILRVESRGSIAVTAGRAPGIADRFAAWRERLRGRMLRRLTDTLPRDDAERDALLVALLLGRRDAALGPLAAAFQRVGLAHVLAVSGMNLCLVVGMAVIAARFLGARRRTEGAVGFAATLAYLVVVEAQVPVLRAGLMAGCVALGAILGRRWRSESLVALSGMALLLWRPHQLFEPGFQLSYGAVLALIVLVPHVRRRWFGARDALAATAAQMIGQRLADSVTVAAVAWAVTTPIAAHHFGMVAPAAILLTLIVLPLVSAILGLGFLIMIIAPLLPSAARLAAVPLDVVTETLIAIVTTADAVPGSVVFVPRPGAAWTTAAVALVALWGFGWMSARPRRAAAAVAIAAAWYGAPHLLESHAPALRVDMLAVGDGSCYVLRAGGEAIVFDAGSSDLGAGDRVIVPAMRALGVRRVAAIVISHANLDHYSAALEIVDAFGVRRVYVSPQSVRHAGEEPLGGFAQLLRELDARRVLVSEVAAGATWAMGSAAVRFLHPPAGADPPRANDASLVVMIEVAGRRVLLTGDIQAEAIEQVRCSLGAADDGVMPPGHVDVVELPHHGSFSEAAASFVASLGAFVLMQSTGRARLENDRWPEVVGAADRLVTARDGAAFVEIDTAGGIVTGCFRDVRASRRTPALNAVPLSSQHENDARDEANDRRPDIAAPRRVR
jgi:competence protein ComEC